MGQHKGSVVWSLVLHIAVLAVLMTGIALPQRPRVEVATAPIVGTIVDTAAIERQQKAREDAARQERQRQQREDRERREAAEQQRQAQQREEQRVANEQRARDEAAQKERDRVAADKAAAERREQQAREERERQAAADKERQAREQREREEAAKRERERAAQRQREEDMLRVAAREGEANAARESGLYDQYVFAIQQRIRSKWQRPLSARQGIDCVVTVVQLPTGVVVSAKVASCNGDDAVRQSIERAVLAASPLPQAPSPALYQRNVNVRFQPEE
jgi:colicin import membrane protein